MMAVLGVQFVITMMMATVLSRVGPHLSIARWLLCSRSVMDIIVSPQYSNVLNNTFGFIGLLDW